MTKATTATGAPRRAANNTRTTGGSAISPQRVGVVVLGMHRSGTSALTRVLSLLGCALPKHLVAAHSSNAAGHWESDVVVALNDQALNSAGSDWFDWQPIADDWGKSLVYEDFVERARTALRDEYGSARLFVLKDPRICRLAGLWFDALEREAVAPAVIIPLRNPLEVAASLAKRDGHDVSVATLMWLRHVLDAEIASRGRQRVFVGYDDLLANWAGVAEHMSRTLGLIWPRQGVAAGEQIEGFLTRDLRHHSVSSQDALDNPQLSGWIKRVYAILLAWSGGAEDAAHYAELDGIRHALDEAGPAFVRPLRVLGQEKARGDALQAEMAQHKEAVQASHAVLAERDAQLEEAAACLRHANRQVHELELALQQASDNVQSLNERLVATESRLRQCEEETDQTNAELARERERLQDLEQQRAQELVQVERLQAKVQDADAWVLKLSAERAGTETEARRLQSALERSESARAAAEKQAEIARGLTALRVPDQSQRVGELETELAAKRGELEAASNDLRATRSAQQESDVRLNQSFSELAQISGMLRTAEQRCGIEGERADWLRQVHRVLNHRPWWWAWMPRKWQKQRIQSRLFRKGLFDADAYLARYPDVASSGIDPLQHYILHGQVEGRVW